MNITVIGDVHGKYLQYANIIKRNNISRSIQLGDMLIGFGMDGYLLSYFLFGIKGEHSFIRGNHDNHLSCKRFKQYLGSWNYLKDIDAICIGGAMSVDKKNRLEGVDWWQSLLISLTLMQLIYDFCAKNKPSIIISHDCPFSIYTKVFDFSNPQSSRTSLFLLRLFGLYSPKLWIFGHHHQSINTDYCGTKFICLDLLLTYTIVTLNIKQDNTLKLK